MLFIGTPRGLENRLVPAAGFPLRVIQIGRLNSVSLGTKVRTLSVLPRAIWDAAQMISDFRPEVVIGVGGYASGPAMLAAALRRIPTLVFEPNYVPGLANRIMAPVASAAAVQFAETGRYFRHCKVTGVPVRSDFFQVSEGTNGRGGKPPTLLVFGGSQGSHLINQAVISSVSHLQEAIPGLQIIHQTGERDFAVAQESYAKNGVTVETHRFLEDMAGFFARADLVLCRSGASTVAELAAAGKPAILVPFSGAADDHQKRNAEALRSAGAALMLEEPDLREETLVPMVSGVLRDHFRLRSMAEAAKKLSRPNAAKDIGEMAASLVHRSLRRSGA